MSGHRHAWEANAAGTQRQCQGCGVLQVKIAGRWVRDVRRYFAVWRG